MLNDVCKRLISMYKLRARFSTSLPFDTHHVCRSYNIYIYIHIYVRMYVCMYVYIYIYIYICGLRLAVVGAALLAAGLVEPGPHHDPVVPAVLHAIDLAEVDIGDDMIAGCRHLCDLIPPYGEERRLLERSAAGARERRMLVICICTCICICMYMCICVGI